MPVTTSWKNSSLLSKLTRHKLGRRLLRSLGSGYIECPVNSFKLYLDLADRWGVSKYILRHGNYDPEICAVVKKNIPPQATCLDIGANIGFWTNFLLCEAGAKYVYAIEPEPRNLELFRSNLVLNSNSDLTQVFSCAVGAKDGQLDLYLSADNAGDHQLYKTSEDQAHIKVEVKRVDDLVPDRQIDFIKMDVQGYEPFVIEGMQNTLLRNRDVIILTEFWPSGIERAGGSPERMLQQLSSFEFKFFHLNRSGLLKELSAKEVLQGVEPGHHVDLLLSRGLLAG